MSDFMSLLFYVSAFTISSVLVGYGYSKKQLPVIALGLSLPILIGGFRYGVGSDYFAYVDIFNAQSQLPISDFIQSNGYTELGFFLINNVSYILFGDIRFSLVVCAALTIIFFYIGLAKYKLKHTGLIFFLYLLTIFPMTLNTIRQGVAMSIVFYAMTFIPQRRPFVFIVWTLIASLFHTSALLMLPIYPVGIYMNDKKVFNDIGSVIKQKYFLRLAIVIVILTVITNNVFNIVLSQDIFSKYELYTTYSEESSNSIYFIKIIILGLILVLSYRIIFNSKDKINALLFAFACVEIVFLSLGFVSPFIKRQALYFAPYSLMLLPMIITTFSDRGGKMLGYSISLIYGLGFFVVSYYILEQADIIPLMFRLKGGA